jgi:hypothetical protein
MDGVTVPVACNMAAFRWVFDAASFDENVRPPAEEDDWLRRTGVSARFVPEALVWHYKAPEEIRVMRILRLAWFRGSEAGWWIRERVKISSRERRKMAAGCMNTSARAFAHAILRLCWGGVAVGLAEFSKALALVGLINRRRARATELEVTPQAKLEKYGVALLASRVGKLGADPCGGSEVVLWEDAAILKDAGIPVRVYGSAAFEGAPVNVLPLRTALPLITSTEYAMKLLRKEREGLIVAYNEPSLAGWAPDRVIARFDWSTALPSYWNWPVWRSRFRRARYLFPSENERRLFFERNPGIPERCTSVIPNAVNLRLFRPAKNAIDNRPADDAAGWLCGTVGTGQRDL